MISDNNVQTNERTAHKQNYIISDNAGYGNDNSNSNNKNNNSINVIVIIMTMMMMQR